MLERQFNQEVEVVSLQSETKSSTIVFEHHNVMKYCVVMCWGYFMLNPCCRRRMVRVYICTFMLSAFCISPIFVVEISNPLLYLRA